MQACTSQPTSPGNAPGTRVLGPNSPDLSPSTYGWPRKIQREQQPHLLKTETKASLNLGVPLTSTPTKLDSKHPPSTHKIFQITVEYPLHLPAQMVHQYSYSVFPRDVQEVNPYHQSTPVREHSPPHRGTAKSPPPTFIHQADDASDLRNWPRHTERAAPPPPPNHQTA